MIHDVSGDLLLSQAQLLAHGLAPNDECKTTHPKPGSVWLWRGFDGAGKQVRIAALLTQEPPQHEGGHPGKAHTEYLNRALHELKHVLQTEGLRSLAVPRLCTGVGGLDWKHVQPLLQAQLGEL